MSYSSTYPSCGKRPCESVSNLDGHVKENPSDLCSLPHRDNNLMLTNEISKLTNYKKPIECQRDWLNNSKTSIFLTRFNKSHEWSKNSKIDLVSFERSNNIEKAQEFLTESGILGSNHLNHSRELITKTSRIHLDVNVQSQVCRYICQIGKNNMICFFYILYFITKKIRKTSLGLRSRKFGDHYPLTMTRQKYLPQTTAESYDSRLQHTQIQVHHLKEFIETETTKILILRAEVSKIKVMCLMFIACAF